MEGISEEKISLWKSIQLSIMLSVLENVKMSMTFKHWGGRIKMHTNTWQRRMC